MCHKDHNVFTKSNSILASMMLIYLITDTHTAVIPSRIVIFVDVRNYITLIIALKLATP